MATALKVFRDASPNLSESPTPSLLSNCLWNFFGLTAPLLAAAVAIPRLIHALGADKFGFLTIAWSLIGYFSLFDLGLGRALTKLVAEKLGRGRVDEIPSSLWTAILLMALMGCVGATALALCASIIAKRVLNIPAGLQHEIEICIYLIAITIPVVTVTAGYRGFLEANQRFAGLSVIRVITGTATFLGPIAVLRYSNTLPPILALLVAARLVTLLAYFAMSVRVEPQLFSNFELNWATASLLLRYGGWMTVSNLVGPIMNSLDRFILGSLVPIGLVSYYATPQEIVTKLSLIPSALIGVLFPSFSSSLADASGRAQMLYGQALRFSLLSVIPIGVLTMLFAPEGLSLWLGARFAVAAAGVTQILMFGVILNAIALVPFTFIQAAGRPDLTAKLHLTELPVYLGICFLLIRHLGIRGAAFAWTIRITIDTVASLVIADRWVRREHEELLAQLIWLLVPVLSAFLAFEHSSLVARSVFFGIFSIFYSAALFSLWTTRSRAKGPALEGI